MKILVLSFILLSGCASTSTVQITKPAPIITYESNLFMENGNICMTPDNFLEHRLWMEDVKRYVIESNKAIEYYQ